MIAFIDNKDSFTFNIVQSLERVSSDQVCVFRSEECSVKDIEDAKPDFLVVGPGPGTPQQAGISIEAIRYFAGKLPILGICLGHQAIGAAFGAKIVGARYIRHGIVESMNADGKGLFRIIGKSGTFTRYHSLVIDESTLPEDFEVSCRAKDGDIMGIRHKSMIIEGVQFHPESIASQLGDSIFKAFLNYRRENLDTAAYINKLLAGKDLTEEEAASFMDVVTAGTGKLCAVPGMTVAGKTGTTSDDVDIWFSGYTPYLTATIWSGYDNNDSLLDLSDSQRKLFKYLKDKLSNIANGSETIDTLETSVGPARYISTRVTIKESDVPNIRSMTENDIEYIEIHEVLARLIMDCPYALYWWNISDDGGYEVTDSENGISITFYVARDFAVKDGDRFYRDKLAENSIINVKKVVENAKKIDVHAIGKALSGKNAGEDILDTNVIQFLEDNDSKPDKKTMNF